MLKTYRCFTIGIHLLLLVHIGHTFVLLTANIDDVKKLAKKFVSDSFAEKIANFLVKATKKAMNSHENNLSDLSFEEENTKYVKGGQLEGSDSFEGRTNTKYEAKKFQPYYPKKSDKYGFKEEKIKWLDGAGEEFDNNKKPDERLIEQYTYNTEKKDNKKSFNKENTEYDVTGSKYINSEPYGKKKFKPLKKKSFEKDGVEFREAIQPNEELDSPGAVKIDIITTEKGQEKNEDSTSPVFVASSGDLLLKKMPDDVTN